MELIEKVICGLKKLRDNSDYTDSYCIVDCDECPYGDEEYCYKQIIDDAIELLKAQKPRVLTLEELKEGESYWLIAGEDFKPRPVICVHREVDARKPYIVFTWQYGTFSWESEDYGKTWRCWSAKPTDEQRMAVKWDE